MTLVEVGLGLVEDGYNAPTSDDGIEVSKKDMNSDQKKQFQMHHKAITFMLNAITFKGLNKYSNKETTKNILDVIVLTYKGSKQVQEAKANLLGRKYGLFQLMEDEVIEMMFSRFQTIVLGWRMLQKSYSIAYHVKKMVRSIPSKWRPRITTILEANNLNNLCLEEVISSL
ncbi:uncharacterized protein [Cicer arietinum]|uniref:uncharacterized protein n=1 Tax=Cicer arietinum TaxID=3827 RepID=UPI003CC55709